MIHTMEIFYLSAMKSALMFKAATHTSIVSEVDEEGYRGLWRDSLRESSYLITIM